MDDRDLKSLFGQAVELPSAEERVQLLDATCKDRPEMRAEIECLLAAHDRAGNFLVQTGNAQSLRHEQPLGSCVGNYKLVELIGEGGMGVVYRAEQLAPVKRQVALKIIKPGMDSRQVIARFEAERQAVALMDHPSIARVLDAGATESGRPYFVMELVEGAPITQYCDDNQLSVNQRLELMLHVCQAIQHAHQKGIIHRDIKPTNVLVAQCGGRAVPKVIDFGVAKATAQKLTERTIFTELGQIVGTLEYMSPEQAELNQLDIDTRSDIYSLGVLVYELVTGSTPFDKQRLRSVAFHEMLRIIREEEPETVSTRIARTRVESRQAGSGSEKDGSNPPAEIRKPKWNELDWIVMKAIDKDRTHRYVSASAFADDVGRYLSDEPVQACPPSAIYRLQKFARRNRGGLATAAAVGVALLMGTALATWQAIRATNANHLAGDRLVEVEKQRIQAELHLEKAIAASELADKRFAEVEVERALAEKNFEAALAGVDRLLAQVGSRKGALPLPEASRRQLLADALTLYDQLIAQSGSSLKARVWAAATSSNVAAYWRDIGELESARQAYTRAIDLYSGIAAENPTIENRGRLAQEIRHTAMFHLRKKNDFQQEVSFFRRSLAIHTDLLNEILTDEQRRTFGDRQLWDMLLLASALRKIGGLDEARAIDEQILALTTEEEACYPRLCVLRRKARLLASDSPDEAEVIHRRVLTGIRLYYKNHPNNESARSDTAWMLMSIGDFFANRHPQEAKPLYAEAGMVLLKLAHDYPASFDMDYARRYLVVLERQVNLLRRMASEADMQTASAGYLAEADRLTNEAAGYRRQVIGDASESENRYMLVDARTAEARKLRRAAASTVLHDPDQAAEELAEADRQFRQALAALRERVAASSEPTHRERLIPLLREQALHLLEQASSHESLENLAIAEGQRSEAAELLQEAIEHEAHFQLQKNVAGGQPADQHLVDIERERVLAERNLEVAFTAVDRLLDQLTAKKGALPLPKSARRRLLTDALTLSDQIVAQSGDSFKARQWAAKTTSRIARHWQDMGERNAAHQAFAKAVQLHEAVVKDEATIENRHQWIRSICDLARYHFRIVKDFDQEAQNFRRALTLYEALLKEPLLRTQRDQYESERFIEMNGLEIALSAGGRRDEAFAVNEQVLALTEGKRAYKARINALQVKARALAGKSPQEAEELYRLALEEGRLWFEQAPKNESRQNQFAMILENGGIFLADRSPAEARTLFNEAIALRSGLVQDYPAKADYLTGHIRLLERQAWLLRRMASRASSAEVLGESESVAERSLDPMDDHRRAAILAEAEALLNEAASFRSRLPGSDPNKATAVDGIAAEAKNLRQAADKAAKSESK